jgi:hypothetical protein
MERRPPKNDEFASVPWRRAPILGQQSPSLRASTSGSEGGGLLDDARDGRQPTAGGDVVEKLGAARPPASEARASPARG